MVLFLFLSRSNSFIGLVLARSLEARSSSIEEVLEVNCHFLRQPVAIKVALVEQ